MSTPIPSATMPYYKGLQLAISLHNPDTASNPEPDYWEERKLFESGQKDYAIMKYPRWGLHHIGEEPQHKLTITDLIRSGPDAGAQLVVCSIDSPTQERILPKVVAKIYDPWCYPVKIRFSDNWDPDEEVVTCTSPRALSDYKAEARTYRHLQQTDTRAMTAGYVPQFHGSWITRMPAPPKSAAANAKEQQRAVCLVIIEYIEGITLFQLTYNPKEGVSDRWLSDEGYPEEWLEDATKQYLQAEARLYQAGIGHNDLGSQNIMVAPSPASAMELLRGTKHAKRTSRERSRARTQETTSERNADSVVGGLPKPRIIIFDFGRANISYVEDLPQNPIAHHWDYAEESFTRLAPRSWFEDETRQDWLKTHFGGDRAKEYEPLNV